MKPLDLIAGQPTSPLIQARMPTSKSPHPCHHTGLAALFSRQKSIFVQEVSLILEKIEKFLEDRELTPAQVSRVEMLVISNNSLSDMSRTQESLTLKIPRVILKLPEIKV